jgi:hypothetical protein
MVSKLGAERRTNECSGGAVDFLLREGQLEIPCRVSFEALKRRAGVFELSSARANRLFNWYRDELERIALSRYAAGDFRSGIVTIDTTDIPSPASAKH